MMEELFQKRLSAFYNSLMFNKQDLWGNSDAVVIHTQPERNPNSVSSQFYLWLVGEELDDTTTMFTSSSIYFLCSQKNYTKIRSLCCSATLMQKNPVSVQLKAKNDDGLALIDATLRNARLIRNSKLFTGSLGDDGSWPYVLGYVQGEYPKSKLFWNCFNELEPRKFKAVDVSCGVDMMIKTADEPNFGVGVGVGGSDDKEVIKSVEFGSPKHIFSTPVNAGKEKGIWGTNNNLKDKGESSLWSGHDDQVFKQMLMEKEKSNLESKFKRIGLCEKGSSNLGSEFAINKLLWGDKGKGRLGRVNENPLSTTKTNENVSVLMENLNVSSSSSSSSSSSGKQDKLRVANICSDKQFKFGGNWLDGGEGDNSKAGNKDGDQEFKFGASILDGNEGKLEEISKNGDEVFRFGAIKLDGEDGKSKEVNKNGDQLFKFGEGKKDDDQQFKIGGKRGRNLQSQLMEESKGAKDVKLLSERLTAFYSTWRTYKEEQWGKADVLVITTQSVGPLETLYRPVSSSFLVWLLDDEFPETTAVFTDTGIEFLCTNESFFRLRTIGIRITMVAKVTVSVQLKKQGEQCLDWLRRTLCQVNAAPRSGANWCPLVVGCISWESTEIGVLSRSKMFEVAYVDKSLINLFEQGNIEKIESFAAQRSTLPKQFQMLSLETCSGAKTANADVSLSEVTKIRPMDDNSYVSHPPEEERLLLEKMGDTLSSLLGGQVQQSKLADKMVLLHIKEGDMDTSITEDGAEPLPQVKEGEEQSTPTAGGMDLSVQPTGVTEAASENSSPDGNNGSSRKDSAGSDHEDDWTFIEMECEKQEAEVSERVSWKRWLMDKTAKSFGLKDEVSDEAPSKRTKADP